MTPATHPPDIRRILILGNSGFIGSHLERVFRHRFPGLEVTGFSAPRMDLTAEKDAEKLAAFLDPFTAVVMCAAIKRQLGDNLDSFSRNVRMALNLCEVLQRHPVKRLVFFSSAAVYGEENHNTAITEETPVNPTSLYGAAKFACECLFANVLRSMSCSLLFLRPPLIYGPGDTGSGYGPSGFVKAALAGEPITTWGAGSERREFLFVEDVAEIVSRLALHDCAGPLNLASGIAYSYLDILDCLSRILPGEIRTTPRPRTKKEVDHGFRNDRLMALLPAFEFTPLEEGVRRLVARHGEN